MVQGHVASYTEAEVGPTLSLYTLSSNSVEDSEVNRRVSLPIKDKLGSMGPKAKEVNRKGGQAALINIL